MLRGETMIDPTMRTVHFYAYGGPEQLVMEQVPRPHPQAGEVLVRVHTAGVNPVDWKVRRGFFKEVRPVPLPFTATC
jgi:NADPH:quinone reductase-like Zn-dependent oxidoreductase